MVLPMARDLGKYGIRVVSIAPGAIDSEIMKNVPEKALKKYQSTLERLTPMKQNGKPEDFSHFV